MHEQTADIMIQKYEKALSVRREFEELYDEIFEYCLPQRQVDKALVYLLCKI